MNSHDTEHDFLTRIITVLKLMVAMFSAFWLTIDFDLRVLVVLSVADVVSTFFNAQRSLVTVTKRLGATFLLVGVTHYVFGLAKQSTGLNVGFDVSAVICTFYILGEVIAIIRNLAAVIQIPPALLEVLAKAEGMTGADRQEIEALRLKQNQETTALDLKQHQHKDEAE